MCPDFGTPKMILDLEQMEILLFLGVPILRHFTVAQSMKMKMSNLPLLTSQWAHNIKMWIRSQCNIHTSFCPLCLLGSVGFATSNLASSFTEAFFWLISKQYQKYVSLKNHVHRPRQDGCFCNSVVKVCNVHHSDATFSPFSLSSSQHIQRHQTLQSYNIEGNYYKLHRYK